MDYQIYEDIARRSNGEIYIGVVGPVRTGKSTFIRNFMKQVVIPNMSDKNEIERVTDELPQSADGSIIMTTQPKFIPSVAESISLGKMNMKLRLIDCVGNIVEGVSGIYENNKPRMVRTPWSDKEMPFDKAAELGTLKVIKEHSTVAFVVTCDGTIADIPHSNYKIAEEKVIDELQEQGKPFVVLMNSMSPDSEYCQNAAKNLANRKNCTVLCIDILNMNAESMQNIMQKLLSEFPISRVDINMPKWFKALNTDGAIINSLVSQIKNGMKDIKKINEINSFENLIFDKEDIKSPKLESVDLASGVAKFFIDVDHKMFYDCLNEVSGEQIQDEFAILDYIKNVQIAKKQYEKFKLALDEVMANGYGVVNPQADEMVLEEPEIVKHGSRFGLKLKASAPTLHIMRVDINTELSPIVGTAEQSEDMMKFMLSQFENDKKSIWESNMFGKPLNMMMREGLQNKVHSMPQNAQKKMRRTLSKIINEGKGGMICILL